MIEVDGLAKRFGTVQAVADVSFRAADGQVTGLLGPNGAGKTTTLRMLYGLIRPDAGVARIDEIDVWADPHAARARFGALPDSRGLYARLSARENIRYYGWLHQLGGAELERRIDELAALLDITALMDRRVAGFSSGERMKVATARALVHQPHNILLDEPTTGLDVMSTRAVRSFIGRQRDEGRCVVFSSHVMQEVSALCDRIVIVARGEVVAEGAPDDLREQAGTEDLEDVFVRLSGAESPLDEAGGEAP